MIRAIASRWPAKTPWWIALASGACLAACPSISAAQDKSDASAKAQEAPGDAEKSRVKDKEDVAVADRFVDPHAKDALAIFKPFNYTGPPIRLIGAVNALGKMSNIVSGSENIDNTFIKNYVEYFAVELSKRDNINALVNRPEKMDVNAPAARGLERAVDALVKPLIDARALDKPNFINTYTRILFESSLPKLLDNNYLTRIDAMIVLGTAGGTSNQALDLYIDQLKQPEQVVWVKLWAAKGLTNAAKGGQVNLETSKAINAAEALVQLLDSDPKLFYPVQVRALEALGAVRIAAATRLEQKVDAASVATRFLADPSAELQVRAYAAWALGMMRVGPQTKPFNFLLVGKEIGGLAVDLADKIVEHYDANASNYNAEVRLKDEVYTGLLLFQVVQSLSGIDGVSDSGLLRTNHPDFPAARPFLTALEEKVKAVGREAFEMMRAGGTSQKTERDQLKAKADELRDFLKSSPALPNRKVTPDGPEIPEASTPVASLDGK